MPIILVFGLVAACMPIPWPESLLGYHESGVLISTEAAVALSLLTAFTLRTWVLRTLRRDPSRKVEVATVYARVRAVMLFVNIGLVALCVLVLGWGWYVQHTFLVADPHGLGLTLAPFAELLVPGPYFVILFGAWTIYYDAERQLNQTTVRGLIERPFVGRFGYFLQNFRQFLLLVMLPVGLFVTQQTIARFAPETAQQDWYRVASAAMVPMLMLFMPLLIKPLLGLKSMPAGPVRSRLEAIAARLHFRCTDFLLWPTHGAMANAMIVGLLPRVRYVVFTDRILEEMPPDELDAVFGHEVGHAKHGHIWLYAAFLLLSMTMLAALVLLIGQELDAAKVKIPEWAKDWLALPPVILLAGYIFLVFGYLSRRCERQADVYGCRAVSCGNSGCTGHDDETVYPERAQGLCPTGIRTFVRALERVGFLNGRPEAGVEAEPQQSLWAMLKAGFAWLRAWQHSTMQRRVEFLLSLIGNPDRERRFQRAVTVLRWGLIVGLVVTLYAIGNAVGWHELLQTL